MRYLVIAGLALVAAAPAARAQWKEAGKTAAGNSVFVDTKSVKTKDGIMSARVRVSFATPVETSQGPSSLSRHDMMFNCAKQTVAGKASTYYSDAAATKVVKKDVIGIPGFGSRIGGSMTRSALGYVCALKK